MFFFKINLKIDNIRKKSKKKNTNDKQKIKTNLKK